MIWVTTNTIRALIQHHPPNSERCQHIYFIVLFQKKIKSDTTLWLLIRNCNYLWLLIRIIFTLQYLLMKHRKNSLLDKHIEKKKDNFLKNQISLCNTNAHIMHNWQNFQLFPERTGCFQRRLTNSFSQASKTKMEDEDHLIHWTFQIMKILLCLCTYSENKKSNSLKRAFSLFKRSCLFQYYMEWQRILSAEVIWNEDSSRRHTEDITGSWKQ